MKSFYLGIDISKKKFDVALLLDEKYMSRTFENKLQGFQALLSWLLQHVSVDKLHACMESTGSYGDALAAFLHTAKVLISVVNPAQIKSFGRSELARVKTDKVDAGLIARFCKSNKPKSWQPLLPCISELRALGGQYAFLKKTRRAQKNRLEANPPEHVKKYILEMLSFIQEHMEHIKAEMLTLIKQTSSLRKQSDLLATIP